MAKKANNEIFELIDEMYNDVKHKSNDPEILAILMKAAVALNKGWSEPVVATKTVNGISLIIMRKKLNLGETFGRDYNGLIAIIRASNYKWSSGDIGDIRVQF